MNGKCICERFGYPIRVRRPTNLDRDRRFVKVAVFQCKRLSVKMCEFEFEVHGDIAEGAPSSYGAKI